MPTRARTSTSSRGRAAPRSPVSRTDAATRGTATLAAVPQELLDALERACADGVAARASDRLSSAHDASHYLLTPQAVVSPDSVDEVAAVLAGCAAVGTPVTFRSGGTSLSGQEGTDGVLVDTRRHFRQVTVLDGGDRVRTGPGAT